MVVVIDLKQPYKLRLSEAVSSKLAGSSVWWHVLFDCCCSIVPCARESGRSDQDNDKELIRDLCHT